MQRLVKDKLEWDDDISTEDRMTWERWRNEIYGLEDINVQRCFKPKEFGEIVDVAMHHFSDASTIGYGQASYLRLVDNNNKVSCNLVIGKSRVAPVKQTTVPRLELTAAVVSTRVSNLLMKELTYENVRGVFWRRHGGRPTNGHGRPATQTPVPFTTVRHVDVQDGNHGLSNEHGRQ